MGESESFERTDAAIHALLDTTVTLASMLSGVVRVPCERRSIALQT